MDDLSRYLKPSPRHGWAWWLFACLLLAGSAWGALEAVRLHELSVAETARLDALERANRAPPPPKPTRAQLETARQWAVLRQERGFSWYPIFAALERATTSDIALLEFVPDKSARTLALRGSARTLEALTGYLDALAGESAFHEVYLTNQKNIRQGDLTVIGFEIRMQIR